MKSVDDAVEIGVFVPAMPDKGRHHVVSRGQKPDFYRPEDLRDKGPGKTGWEGTFEKILVGLYLVLEAPVPYAFRTPDGQVRSLDAGCMKMLANRIPPEITFNRDADGFIDTVIPSPILVKRYAQIADRLKQRVNELPLRTDMAEMTDSSAPPTFILTAGKAKARARPDEGRTLIVLKGSTALRLNNRSTTSRERDERDDLIRAGVLVPDPRNPELLRFARDHAFSSASAAAGVINDGNVSGPQSWKNPATRKTLKDYWGR